MNSVLRYFDELGAGKRPPWNGNFSMSHPTMDKIRKEVPLALKLSTNIYQWY